MEPKPFFKVIERSYSADFAKAINDAIDEGYVPYGEPQFRMVSCQDTWNNRQRAWTEQSYVQCMKIK